MSKAAAPNPLLGQMAALPHAAGMPTIVWSGATNANGHVIEVAEVKLGGPPAQRMVTVSPGEPKYVEPEDLSAVTSALTAIGGTVATRSW